MIKKYKSPNATCVRCGQPIIWVKTYTGKFMPFEKFYTVTYNLKGEMLKGHLPHWKYCPNRLTKKPENVTM